MERISEKRCRQMIKSYNMIFAMTIVDLISEIVTEECYGCSVDHPSQVQQSCIMETPRTHLWMYFDLAVEKVNNEIVMEKWLKEIAAWDIPDSINVDKDAMIFSKWIERRIPDTESWREEITNICDNMMKINSRYVKCKKETQSIRFVGLYKCSLKTNLLL